MSVVYWFMCGFGCVISIASSLIFPTFPRFLVNVDLFF